jgi:hypothetical protein
MYPINDKIGNTPYGQGQLIQNNPFTVDHGVYEWAATNVRDEKNATFKSDRIQTELDALNLANVITYDYEREGEMWIASGVNVYIYNYRLDVWYKFILSHTPTCFLDIDGDLYFGTSAGQIMMFSEESLTDNGTKIADLMVTGEIDFDIAWKRKFLQFGFIGLQPEGRSRALINWVTDIDASTDDETISYTNLTYTSIDYSDWTYLASYSPQPKKIKIKAKKFTYINFIISCDSETNTMTILSINLPANVGGISK